MRPTLSYSPSLEGTLSAGGETLRHSLYHNRADFIQRVGPLGMAAIYFGNFSLGPQDAALSRQALFKLSFIYRHFLKPAGLGILVQRQTAILSGEVESTMLVSLAEILAGQIEGILKVKDETGGKIVRAQTHEMRERVQLLFATDQTLSPGLMVQSEGLGLQLSGSANSPKQKAWAELLASAVGVKVQSKVEIVPETNGVLSQTMELDDESLQALVLFRLRLVRETEHMPLKIKANRGVVSLSGKVRTEALRQQVENITRSTMGLRELRSALTIAG